MLLRILHICINSYFPETDVTMIMTTKKKTNENHAVIDGSIILVIIPHNNRTMDVQHVKIV